MSPWDFTEIVDRLCELHADKANSFSGIAEALSKEFNIPISRNACIAKCRRLGLEKRPPTSGNPSPTDPEILRERRNRRRRESRQWTFTQRSSPLSKGDLIRHKWQQMFLGLTEALPPEDTYCPPKSRISLFDLENNTCRWPYEGEHGFQFCGHDGADFKGRVPYCPYHSVMAQRPADRRQAAE